MGNRAFGVRQALRTGFCSRVCANAGKYEAPLPAIAVLSTLYNRIIRPLFDNNLNLPVGKLGNRGLSQFAFSGDSFRIARFQRAESQVVLSFVFSTRSFSPLISLFSLSMSCRGQANLRPHEAASLWPYLEEVRGCPPCSKQNAIQQSVFDAEPVCLNPAYRDTYYGAGCR